MDRKIEKRRLDKDIELQLQVAGDQQDSLTAIEKSCVLPICQCAALSLVASGWLFDVGLYFSGLWWLRRINASFTEKKNSALELEALQAGLVEVMLLAQRGAVNVARDVLEHSEPRVL